MAVDTASREPAAGDNDPTFHRPPRDWPDPPPSDELRMHAPPTRPEPPSGGFMYALFPVMGSFGLIAFAFVYDNPLFIYIGVGMAFLSVLMVIGIRWSQARSVKKKRKSNRRKYREYLTSVERRLSGDATAQLNHGDRLYPDHERLWGLVLARRHLWERRAGDADFLRVRLGRGEVPHSRPLRLDVSDDPITERERDLEDEAATVKKRWQQITDAPVVVDLRDAPVVSVVGPPEAGRALARSIVSQLAAFRAPNDVRLLAAFEPACVGEWEWMKWLPHVRGQARPRPGSHGPPPRTVLLADSAEHLAQLLEDELGPRLEQLQRIDEQGAAGGRATLDAPRLVIVVDGFSPTAPVAQLASIRDAMERGARLQTSLILLSESAEHEPSEADLRVSLTHGAATVEERSGGEAERRRWQGVWPDAADRGLCEAIARALAPLRLEDRQAGAGAGVADEIRALELMGHASAASLDPLATWRERPARERLRVPLGVTSAGEPLTLDLKEAAQGGLGPHGLIVGATGSGKSELLRTLIAGLAIEHPPEELSVVLIDYKGGSAFAELARLPHAAGLITNLQRDSALVDRMRDALLGEQERRQSLLRDAGELDDIGAYRLARERDPSLAPLPHLLVVVDEFSELLSARPEFIDLFLGIGRVGRSLGMHLLFSSQRLEEGKLRGLESHLRYRICLRTYSAIESKLVLGTPDAYLLPPFPGAAYMKVDTGTYERFKVALVSGSRRREAEPAAPSERVQVFSSAQAALEPEAAKAQEPEPSGPSDLEAIVSRLGEAHAGGGVHQVWVAPLEHEVDLVEVEQDPPWWARTERAGGLAVAVGLLDLPAEQRTEPLVLDFEGAAGHLALVGAPQSGKSTFLRTLAGSLMRRHRPDEVRLYVLDLGGGGLSSLAGLPHVSGVAAKVGRDEVRQTVRHIQALLVRREASFRELGLSSMADARAARVTPALAQEDLADVFLLVDGWAVLRSDFEELDRDLEQIAVEGLNFGMHLAITAGRWAEMRPGLRDNVGRRLELRLNDPIESELGRRVAETLPTDVPGRGLTSAKLHFQSAVTEREDLEQAARRWEGPPAPPVPILPRLIEAAELPAGDSGVPIGLDEMGLEPVQVDLAAGDPHFLVLGDSESGKTNLLRLFARGLLERQDAGQARLVVVDYRRGLIDLSGEDGVHAYAANATMAAEAVSDLRDELEARLPGPEASHEQLLRGPGWSGPRCYLLVDDYDLVPSANVNPLLPLLDMLAQGRDVGLHLVLARRIGGMSTSAFEAFMQRLLELRTPGLLMSGSPSEGSLLGGHRARSLPPGRGLLVRRDATAALVQTALSPREEPAAAPLGPHRAT